MMTEKKKVRKIAFVDSGYGGLLTCSHIKKVFPHIETICILDCAYMPYGQKSLGELDSRYMALQKKAQDVGAELVVVACNTLSATAYLRNKALVPTIDIISMSTAFINELQPKEIQLVATPNTIKSKLYPNSVQPSIQILETEAKTLASKIEEGDLEKIVQDFEKLSLNKELPVFLGCTHYSVLLPILNEYKFYSQLNILTDYIGENFHIEKGDKIPGSTIIINSDYERYCRFAKNLFPENQFQVSLQEF
jgi:glutamate racemase